MHLPIRPERSLSPPSAVICLILFMSSQIERMVWNDWCRHHNLVITAPLPIAAIYRCSVQESAAWIVIHSPLTFKKPLRWAPFGSNCTVRLEPSFRWDNKDRMQTRVSWGMCVQEARCAMMISLTRMLKEKEEESARGDDFSTHLGNFDLWGALHLAELMQARAVPLTSGREAGLGSMMHSDWQRTIFHHDRHYQWIIKCLI